MCPDPAVAHTAKAAVTATASAAAAVAAAAVAAAAVGSDKKMSSGDRRGESLCV